jgi:integrase/recombinase XerD
MAASTREQVFESNKKPARDILTKNVARHGEGRFGADAGLYGAGGERKYLNRDERHRVLRAAETLGTERCLFALVLAWTGARISEVLALTPASFQIDTGVVLIVTLKRRKFAVREVPIPPALMKRLDRCFALRRLQQGEHSAQQRLWVWHRATAWRLIKHVMLIARVCGRQACPRGLRHGFGVGALQSSVPLHLIQRWMGHARLSTTAIYMDVCGPEESSFAQRFWRQFPPLPCQA